MISDYHMHTVLCKHATGTAAQFLAEAQRKHLPEICFTDHAPNPDKVGVGLNMEMDELGTYRTMIEDLQTGSTPQVLFGVEADYYPGCEKYLAKWLPAQHFDIVLGSVHWIDGWGFDNPAEIDGWKSADVTGVWRRYLELLAAAVKTMLFDVVGHIDLPKKFGHRISDRVLKDLICPVLDQIADVNMAIEINTSGLRKPAGELYPSSFVLALAREREIPICFGSDAHQPSDVGMDFDKALRHARDVGYTTCVRMRQRLKSSRELPSLDTAAQKNSSK